MNGIKEKIDAANISFFIFTPIGFLLIVK